MGWQTNLVLKIGDKTLEVVPHYDDGSVELLISEGTVAFQMRSAIRLNHDQAIELASQLSWKRPEPKAEGLPGQQRPAATVPPELIAPQRPTPKGDLRLLEDIITYPGGTTSDDIRALAGIVKRLIEANAP